MNPYEASTKRALDKLGLSPNPQQLQQIIKSVEETDTRVYTALAPEHIPGGCEEIVFQHSVELLVRGATFDHR